MCALCILVPSNACIAAARALISVIHGHDGHICHLCHNAPLVAAHSEPVAELRGAHVSGFRQFRCRHADLVESGHHPPAPQLFGPDGQIFDQPEQDVS
jgi:hypothetical protein